MQVDLTVLIHTRLKGSYWTTFIRCVVCIIPFNGSIAQTRDTFHLKDVDVIAGKIELWSIGKKVIAMDSLTLQNFRDQSLADVLQYNSPVFIKNYGPGSISTSAFRGGNASQTAVLWNGLNIQNTMLGQTDMGLINSNLFNAISIEYGGSSGVWGSGAMGGAIHLSNHKKLNDGLRSSINFLNGEYGCRTFGTDMSYSNKMIAASIKAVGTDNENEFRYYDHTLNKISYMKKCGYNNYSIMPEFKIYVNTRHKIETGAWLSSATRQLAGYSTNTSNSIIQSDRSQRYYGAWNYSGNRLMNTLRGGFMQEFLGYNDSLMNIRSTNHMQTVVLENDLFLNWIKGQTLNVGINHTFNNAEANNLGMNRSLYRTALLIGNSGRYINDKLELMTNVRLERTSLQSNPFTYNMGLNYRFTPHLQLQLNAGKVYRLPTFNDLYWQPGGNPLLKPEYGHAMDGSMHYTFKFNQLTFGFIGSIFNKNIHHWILWLPGNSGVATPMNIQKVWSRGSETHWSLSYSQKDLTLQLKFISGYVLSTVSKSDLENDNTTGKQLIYTPRYNFNTHMSISYKTFSISYYHNYTGYRFTTSDNSAWLDPYHIASVRVNYMYYYQKIALGTFLNLNNLFDTPIEIIANRPMPMRTLEIGILLNYHKKNKNI